MQFTSRNRKVPNHYEVEREIKSHMCSLLCYSNYFNALTWFKNYSELLRTAIYIKLTYLFSIPSLDFRNTAMSLINCWL